MSAPSTLDLLERGQVATVASLEVEASEAELLRAMGLVEGGTVQLLRTGLGGDPLHIRLSCGGEFALARPLARAVRIQRAP